jgi:superfamily II DNA or RNA helicase
MLADLRSRVSEGSYERGVAYARADHVLDFDWQGDTGPLAGMVRGTDSVYRTAATFEARQGRLSFDSGHCSCPVGRNCKHVVALVITGVAEMVAETSPAPLAPPARFAAPAAPAAAPAASAAAPAASAEPAAAALAAWESPLRALLAPTYDTVGPPLAFELTAKLSGHPGFGTPRLYGRLMRQSPRGGWVNGSLSWSALDSWHADDSGVREDHLQVARDIYALHRSREVSRFGYSGHRSAHADRTLDLTELDGVRLWSLLEQAEQLGISLIHGHGALGELPRHRHGELLLDITAAEAGSSVAAKVRVDGGPVTEDFWPLMFLGDGGEVLVYSAVTDELDRDELSRHRLQLVRLARATPPALAQMLLAGEQLTIPTGEVGRFRREMSLALRRVAPVVSSDGSFTQPEVSAPRLVLRTAYGEGHLAAVNWQWAYEVDGEEHRTPLGVEADAAGFRDPAAERAQLDTLELSGTGLGRHDLLDAAGRPELGGPHVMESFETLRFSTELLPGLAEVEGVSVEIVGERPNYRDVEDSLEITLATSERPGERDWFDLGVTISVEDRELVFGEVFSALAGGASEMLLEDGAYFMLNSPRLQALRDLIEEARGLTDAQADGSLRISRYQADLWSELAALGVVAQQSEAWRTQVSALLELDDLAEVPVPDTLAAQLRPYQRDGFTWLASLWSLGLGGILADDMGLGKTVQALALICHAQATAPAGLASPFLVIAPTSVVPGWVHEAARFAPGLNVVAVTDTLARARTGIESLITGADVVVTTYTLLRLDADAYGSVGWSGVILDEAQFVKNHQSKTYAAARRLDAPFKLAITGTPMENNLMELWSLLSLTAPGLFPDPQRFAEQYARPIEREGDAERLVRLRRRIRPLMKRRTKELVAADLPAKQEQILEVELHPRHRKLYDTHLQRERQRILGMLEDFRRNRVAILASITRMRQLSLHAGLVDPANDRVPCAKLDVLMEQLTDVVAGGHRALIFSQFTGFLARAQERIEQAGIGYCYLDGKTRSRGTVLERFRTGTDPVFLISLKAGGFGLNLTEADYCFLLDPWWNPATEAQAIDRTHRIGQTRQVMVYRLLAKDTIEEKVSALARRKAALFSGVMDDGDLFSSAITAEDIRGLLD